MWWYKRQFHGKGPNDQINPKYFLKWQRNINHKEVGYLNCFPSKWKVWTLSWFIVIFEYLGPIWSSLGTFPWNYPLHHHSMGSQVVYEGLLSYWWSNGNLPFNARDTGFIPGHATQCLQQSRHGSNLNVHRRVNGQRFGTYIYHTCVCVYI